LNSLEFKQYLQIMTKIGVIGAGRIGGGIARQLAAAGHEVLVAGREPDRLAPLATEIGGRFGTPAEAVAFADVVVLSVPSRALDDALADAGSLDGKIVIDTTNRFGDETGATQASQNAARMPGARYTKSFNTLTSAFQAETAGREPRVVQWLCGDDADAKRVAAGLIEDAGFLPVDLGGTDDAAVMESPRRPGAVYGEEYRAEDAQAVVDAVREGREIPPAPVYGT
jgi:predicted dinucleotide-binding enzyme